MIIENNINIRKFEFCYFFYMVILMAYMTKETRVLPGGLSQPIAWSIPFIWTICIIIRNKVSFNNTNFWFLITLCMLWSFIQIVSKETYELQQIGLYFSFIYAIIVTYVHINVFKKNLFRLYEHCMVIMCKIAVPLWIVSNLFPSVFTSIARMFPRTGYGRNFLYLYNWMDPALGQVQGSLLRNAGCSWEPGRFAVMLCLAIAINLLYNGIEWKKNNNIKWLLCALITTFSTTGFVITACAYFIFIFGNKSARTYKYRPLFLIVAFAAFTYLPFIGEKLDYSLDVSAEIQKREETESWYESNELTLVLDRFPSIILEIENFYHDPWIGYGKDTKKSYFSQTHISFFSTSGGLVQMFSLYGVFIGIFFYCLLYESSKQIAEELHSNHKHVIFLCILFSLISYPLFEFPIFSAIWLYDYLSPKNKHINL